ncbi:hypothetical protein, partial [Olavius algarvensis spirochete endosymbiont]|uniref:hypothetical protein n=1 Tax=Olavius algarvensis spirochete endosymbiont TaxID=260710 RepID=UPI001E65DD2A
VEECARVILSSRLPTGIPNVSNNPVKYIDPDGDETHIFSVFVWGKHRHLFIAAQDAKTMFK